MVRGIKLDGLAGEAELEFKSWSHAAAHAVVVGGC